MLARKLFHTRRPATGVPGTILVLGTTRHRMSTVGAKMQGKVAVKYAKVFSFLGALPEQPVLPRNPLGAHPQISTVPH